MRPRGPAALILLFLLTASLVLPHAVRATAYLVASENVVTGTTSGISGVQGPDGVFETLTEADTAPDPTTYLNVKWVATGSQVSGSFPSAIQTSVFDLIANTGKLKKAMHPT